MLRLLGGALLAVILLIVAIPHIMGELSLLVYRPVHHVTVPPGQTVYFTCRARVSSYFVVSVDGPVRMKYESSMTWPPQPSQISITSCTNREIHVRLRENTWNPWR